MGKLSLLTWVDCQKKIKIKGHFNLILVALGLFVVIVCYLFALTLYLCGPIAFSLIQ